MQQPRLTKTGAPGKQTSYRDPGRLDINPGEKTGRHHSDRGNKAGRFDELHGAKIRSGNAISDLEFGIWDLGFFNSKFQIRNSK